MCSLQLNVFYEFKKKVLLHHERFTKLIENATIPPSKPEPVSPIIQNPPPTSNKHSPSPPPPQVEKPQEIPKEEKTIDYKPPKLLNKSPAAVPAKLQKKIVIKPEHIDEDESYEQIVKYLQTTEDDEDGEDVSVDKKNIKEEYIIYGDGGGDDDENMDIMESVKENISVIEQDIDTEYLEEFYLEEANALETNVANIADENRKSTYDICDSPTFSAIYLDEEFADDDEENDDDMDDDNNDDDENKYLMVERLDDMDTDDMSIKVVMKQKRKRGHQPLKTSKRPRNEVEEQTHVCTSCTMVFTKLSEYRNHL